MVSQDAFHPRISKRDSLVMSDPPVSREAKELLSPPIEAEPKTSRKRLPKRKWSQGSRPSSAGKHQQGHRGRRRSGRTPARQIPMVAIPETAKVTSFHPAKHDGRKKSRRFYDGKTCNVGRDVSPLEYVR